MIGIYADLVEIERAAALGGEGKADGAPLVVAGDEEVVIGDGLLENLLRHMVVQGLFGEEAGFGK